MEDDVFISYRCSSPGTDPHVTPGNGFIWSQPILRGGFIAAGAAKVGLDVQFIRYRADESVIGSLRSLWIVTEDGGRWAVAARSSFAG